MGFLDLVKARYSTRKYSSKMVEEEKLSKVLECARLAPSASNKQPFNLIVIHTKGKENLLREIYDRDWFVNCPIVICACAKPKEAWVRMDGKNYADVDVAIALDHLVMAATELGLGTCWIANFNPIKAKKNLNLEEGIEPIMFISVGYSEDSSRQKVRKDFEQIVEMRK